MIRAYILDVAKMDIEIGNVLNRKPTMKPFQVHDNIGWFQSRFIENERWGIAYKMKEREEMKHCMLFLREKHLYSTSILNQMIAKANKSNSDEDIKCISDMVKWWVVIQKTCRNNIPKVFETL